MTKAILSLLAAAVWLTIALPAQADTAREGVVRCGGNSLVRLSGTEALSTIWTLHNFDSVVPIAINRLRVFNGPGAILFDSAVSNLPLAQDGLLGPLNNIRGPNQSTQFNSLSFISFLPTNQRPIVLELQWSAPKSAQTLDANVTLITTGRDASTGASLERRAEAHIVCLSIFLK